MANKKPIIKGYTFDGNEIVINYGLFKKERIANTTENIRRLNELMKNQVTKKSVKDYRKAKKGTVRNTFICLAITFGLSLLGAPIGILAIPSVIGASHLYRYLSNSYREYKRSKYEFFFKNENDFNEAITKNETDEETLSKTNNVSNKTIETILEEKRHENKNVFDVNSIRKMSFNSLLNLRENLINRKIASQQPVVAETENVDGPTLEKRVA